MNYNDYISKVQISNMRLDFQQSLNGIERGRGSVNSINNKNFANNMLFAS